MKILVLFFVFIVLAVPMLAQDLPLAKPSGEPEPISDNSFLIEEAYNQEAGVVQHINTFTRQRGGDYVYTFTQEYPFTSEKHQLSYTIIGQRVSDPVDGRAQRGFGDFALNYRYQLVSNKRIAISPRATLLLPTGKARRGLGAGGAGLQFNLPVSLRLSRRFVAHSNAGATFTPRARNAINEQGSTQDYFLGQSLVWLANPRFNFLLESLYTNTDSVSGKNSTMRENGFVVNPGVRWAYNFHNGLQIVPGVAVPLGVGPSRGERGVFFYLSFEHPFKKQSR